MASSVMPLPMGQTATGAWAYPTATAGRSAPLDAWRILRDALVIVALLSLNVAGTAGAALFFAILGLMALTNSTNAFKALAICYLGLMINKAFVPKSLVWTPSRLVLPFLAFIRFNIDLGTVRASVVRQLWYPAFLLFVATMAVCSIVSGWFTHIALLKLLNFWAVITTIMSGVAVLRARRVDISEWFLSLIFAATVFGVGAVLLGASSNFRQIKLLDTGQVVNAAGFNGAFLHPNCHATYASLFVAFLMLVGVVGNYRRTWLVVPALVIWLTFIAWSGSRTALLTSVLAVLAIIAYTRPRRNRLGWRLLPNINRGTLFLVITAGLIGTLCLDAVKGGAIRRSVIQFINKGGAADGDIELNTEQILSSRTGLIQRSWDNFQDNVLFGIGFGVAKTEEFVRTATLFTAPAEKGFLPSAILEEGGVIGTTAFVIFIAAFMFTMIRQGNIPGLVTFIAFLITNVGEVTIMAPGGGGSFGWVTVGAAMILGDHCWKPPLSVAYQAGPQANQRSVVTGGMAGT